MAKKEIQKYFGTHCSPCAAVAPIVKRICAELNIPVTNIDVDMFPEMVRGYKIMSIPTLILLEDGKPVKRLAGGFSEQKLRSFLS